MDPLNMLFAWRMKLFTSGVILLFIVVLALLIARHEPWFDEAQAWLLARDAGPWELLVRYLRYEGSPGLWHFILMGPAKLGLPYLTMSLIGGGFAAWGSWIFLRHAPFPWWVKLGMPFSYFLLYQYGVIARCYVLAPLALFSIAHLYDRREEKIFGYMFLLILLSLISLHGMLIAGLLLLIHAGSTVKRWKEMPAPVRWRHLLGFAVYGVTVVLLLAILKVPHDYLGYGAITWNLQILDCSRILSAGMAALNSAMSDLLPVTVGVLLISLAWFWYTGVLLEYLLPTLALSLFFALKPGLIWHHGFLFLIWLFALWLSFNRRKETPVYRYGGYAMLAVTALVLVVMGDPPALPGRLAEFDKCGSRPPNYLREPLKVHERRDQWTTLKVYRIPGGSVNITSCSFPSTGGKSCLAKFGKS